MDILSMRVLDELIDDDDEELEEIYLDANARRKDNTWFMYREQFRLAEVVMCLQKLERDGLVVSKRHPDYPESCGVAAQVFHLTDLGRQAWEKNAKMYPSLYELA